MTSSSLSQTHSPTCQKWSLRFIFSVHVPLWAYAGAEVLQGKIEPLLGGPIENLVVMFAMSSFYATFFIGPSLLLHFRRTKSGESQEGLGPKDAYLLGLLGGVGVLAWVHVLPLNALEPWAIGGLLVLIGASSAFAIHVVGSILLSKKSMP